MNYTFTYLQKYHNIITLFYVSYFVVKYKLNKVND